MQKTILCIPTYNSEKKLLLSLPKVIEQTAKFDELWAIDSSSSDRTVEVLESFGFKVSIIPQFDFNHGRTRNLFFTLAKGDVYLFLTDDAIPADPRTFEELLKTFEDPTIGLAYGRQLPHKNATPFAAHARLFNYPEKAQKKTLVNKDLLGIKTTFCSNSFAAYRFVAIQSVGFFPRNVILSEDTYTAGRMLQSGWGIYYASNAKVYHSHNYSVLEEFKRYFDIGVFYGQESWILSFFGKAHQEGKKFLISEWKYLQRFKKLSFYFEWFFRNGMKWIGYNLGKLEKSFPVWLKKRLSMNARYWESESNKLLFQKEQPEKFLE